MKGKTKTAAVLLLALLCTGCMESKELKERTIIESVGIDKEDGELTVSMQQFLPSSSPSSPSSSEGKGEKSDSLVVTKGRTISEALDKVTHYKGNEVFLGNSTFVVLGKETAAKGINSFLSFFNSVHEVDPGIYIVISDTNAKDIIDSESNIPVTPSTQIEEIMQQGKKGGIVGKSTLMDVLQRMHSDGASPYVPMVQTVKGENGQEQLKIAGTAIFKKDKLADVLSIEETKGLLWATNEIDHAVLVVAQKDIGRVSVEIQDSRTKIKTEIVNGIPQFTVQVKAQGRIQEVMQENGGGVTQQQMKQVAQVTEQKIESIMRQAVEKAMVKNQCDVFRFSDFLKKYQPSYWKANQKQWDEIMPQCQVRYQVECAINRTGLEGVYGKNSKEKEGAGF